MPTRALVDAKIVILTQIDKSPGIRYRELLRLTGLGNGALEHHLKILAMIGLNSASSTTSGLVSGLISTV
jgi:predicted transcriptional regulator